MSSGASLNSTKGDERYTTAAYAPVMSAFRPKKAGSKSQYTTIRSHADVVSSVMYLRTISMAAETIMFQPPTEMQLKNAGAIPLSALTTEWVNPPTITLCSETGCYANNFCVSQGPLDEEKLTNLQLPTWEYDARRLTFRVDAATAANEQYYEEQYFHRVHDARMEIKQKVKERTAAKRHAKRVRSVFQASAQSVQGTVNTHSHRLSDGMLDTPSSFAMNSPSTFVDQSDMLKLKRSGRSRTPGYTPIDADRSARQRDQWENSGTGLTDSQEGERLSSLVASSTPPRSGSVGQTNVRRSGLTRGGPVISPGASAPSGGKAYKNPMDGPAEPIGPIAVRGGNRNCAATGILRSRQNKQPPHQPQRVAPSLTSTPVGSILTPSTPLGNMQRSSGGSVGLPPMSARGGPKDCRGFTVPAVNPSSECTEASLWDTGSSAVAQFTSRSSVPPSAMEGDTVQGGDGRSPRHPLVTPPLNTSTIARGSCYTGSGLTAWRAQTVPIDSSQQRTLPYIDNVTLGTESCSPSTPPPSAAVAATAKGSVTSIGSSSAGVLTKEHTEAAPISMGGKDALSGRETSNVVSSAMATPHRGTTGSVAGLNSGNSAALYSSEFEWERPVSSSRPQSRSGGIRTALTNDSGLLVMAPEPVRKDTNAGDGKGTETVTCPLRKDATLTPDALKTGSMTLEPEGTKRSGSSSGVDRTGQRGGGGGGGATRGPESSQKTAQASQQPPPPQQQQQQQQRGARTGPNSQNSGKGKDNVGTAKGSAALKRSASAGTSAQSTQPHSRTDTMQGGLLNAASGHSGSYQDQHQLGAALSKANSDHAYALSHEPSLTAAPSQPLSSNKKGERKIPVSESKTSAHDGKILGKQNVPMEMAARRVPQVGYTAAVGSASAAKPSGHTGAAKNNTPPIIAASRNGSAPSASPQSKASKEVGEEKVVCGSDIPMYNSKGMRVHDGVAGGDSEAGGDGAGESAGIPQAVNQIEAETVSNRQGSNAAAAQRAEPRSAAENDRKHNQPLHKTAAGKAENDTNEGNTSTIPTSPPPPTRDNNNNNNNTTTVGGGGGGGNAEGKGNTNSGKAATESKKCCTVM